METTEIMLDAMALHFDDLSAKEFFDKINLMICEAETWLELQIIINSLDELDIAILTADEVTDIIAESCDPYGFTTLKDWKQFAAAVETIPEGERYYFWKGQLNFEALSNDSFEDIKEYCRAKVNEFAALLCENGEEIY